MDVCSLVPSISLDNAILSYSDSELAALISDSPRLKQHAAIAVLPNGYLAKACDVTSVDDTIKAIEIARGLGIRVPHLARVVRCEDLAFMIMERVNGETLEDVWPKLGWYASYRLALQLRRYISNMRSVISTTAGSIVSGKCRSFWLDDYFGLPARATATDISAFITFWTNFKSIRDEMKKSDQNRLPLGVSTDVEASALVFTHHDLAPRNIMVDPSGDIWLLDWDFAGFYPCYFEYASMYNFSALHHWDVISRSRWWIFTWTVAGRYEKESQQLQLIRSKFLKYGAGRRFSIKANLTRSRRRVISSESSSSSS